MACLTDLIPGNGTITAEIGLNKFFALQGFDIARSRTPGQSSARLTVETATDATLQPSTPNLVCITGSTGDVLFNGLYDNKDTKFLDMGNKRQFSINVSDFFPFTTRNIIADYQYVDTFESHITRALTLTNAGFVGVLNRLDTAFINLNNDDEILVEGQPDPFAVPYDFQFEGYLNEFLDQQCALANCSWELKANHFNRLSQLTSGAIAYIQIRKNGAGVTEAPQNPLYAPFTNGNAICLDGNLIENLSVNVKGFTLTKVTVLGKNGKYSQDFSLDEASIRETVKRTIPMPPDPQSVVLGYEYNENATKVLQVLVVPNE